MSFIYFFALHRLSAYFVISAHLIYYDSLRCYIIIFNYYFSSHPNISHSRSWHKLNQESMRQSQTQQEIIFSPNSGSVYCESLDGSFEDDLNSVISEFSRSTSVASNASSMLSEGGGAKLEALLRKDKSVGFNICLKI